MFPSPGQRHPKNREQQEVGDFVAEGKIAHRGQIRLGAEVEDEAGAEEGGGPGGEEAGHGAKERRFLMLRKAGGWVAERLWAFQLVCPKETWPDPGVPG